MSNDQMGAVTAVQVEEFWNRVRSELDLTQKFEWSDAEPSICLNDRILIRRSIIGRYPWEAYYEVLHEVAHAMEGAGHGRSFHATYAVLINKFLGFGGRDA